ncbi:AraC family transcriptional regulator [Coraliomargarita sp. SDUM461004]|uniref:AraC family transcriptional regulator n=1 Tax=Thalassobacterium sedimentorum TaxID=3041258 RepID=A0ABU1AJ06_9BACT|nr:AraC family transcriptional regulator [Coraliomargarita sp. SDUM461004]MDQ8194761.1 AraC family transcriptional regulator [Coraliomargarita sp. SDUM461004]
MFNISTTDWPKAYACTYEAYNYSYVPSPLVHSQDYHEFFWIERGRGCHLLNGERRLMESGYFALIRADDSHGFSAWNPSDQVGLINFAFPSSLWEKIRREFFIDQVCFFDHLDIEKREYQLSSDDRERLRQMGNDLAAGRWNSTNAAAFLLGVLALLDNRDRETSASATTPEWLTHALRRIETWPNFVGGVPEFVRIAGRSHEHVSRDCRRLLNTTPREIVNHARLNWASMQLETSQKEILEIAHECGFENLGHFYKLFKTHYKTTPRQYRIKRGITQFP